MLAAIFKQLSTMDERLRSMENKLHIVDAMQAKVSTLAESTGDLGAQQDTLSSAVERIDLAQTLLAANASRGVTAPRDPPQGQPQHAGRHRHGDDDDAAGDDIVSTTHKLEFLKYDGAGDPLPWLNKCKRYFHVRRTPELKRVALAACYLLDDDQLWFHRLELNGGRPTWQQFIQLVNARFGPPLTDTPLGELAMLRRSGSVDEFARQSQQIQLFITGLGDPLRLDVTLQQPSSMDDAVIFARAYEQRLALRETGPQYTARSAGRTGARYAPPQGMSSSAAPSGTAVATPAKSSPPVVRLSPAEIAQRRKNNKCFHCDEFFTNGHKQQCKQLFVIEVLDVDEEEVDHGPTTNEPTISISALTGIHPRKDRTMQVLVTIYDTVLRALLDSGSTHNFMDSEVAARVEIVFSGRTGLSVAVANGDRVASTGSCTNLKILIAGDTFTIDYNGLSLGSYDMVRVQWLESLGPVLWDFKNRTPSFERNGRTVRWWRPHRPNHWDRRSRPHLATSWVSYSFVLRPSSPSRQGCPLIGSVVTRYGCCPARPRWQFIRTGTRIIRSRN
jgi:hypothetical protein